MIVLFSFFLSTLAMQNQHFQHPIDTAQMRKEILTEFAKQPTGTFAVAFEDLATGEQFLINAHQSFHAASTIKTAYLIEAFKQADEHKFSLTDSIFIRNDFTSIVDGSIYHLDSTDDSETDLYKRIGEKETIYNLLFRMITQSSNFSTNLVVDLVGAKNANQTMLSIGAKDIQALRGVEDNKAYEHGMNNTVTAYDLMIIFDHLAKGTVVNKQACDSMIQILMHQQLREKIPAELPVDVKVANKTGSIDKISHDSGIVFLPDGRKYVLVLLSSGVEDEKSVNATLANVSRIIYDHFVNNK